ncbi:hypothetical protein ABN235_18745 [Morganella morganii]|uniref:hypothetical protein n=1 Tax=Morganella morganii TaxID=582 RepID=UPI0032D9BB00
MEEAKRAEAARLQRSQQMERRRQEDEERKKKRQEQLTAKEKEDEKFIRSHRIGIKEESTKFLSEIIVSFLAKTDLSFHSGLTPSECIEWWRDGVIEGNLIGEAFINYIHLDVSEEYRGKVNSKDPVKTRAAINEKRKENKK